MEIPKGVFVLQVLWTIQDLDQKWLLLQKRKSALQSYYTKRFEEENRRVYDETRLRLNKQLFQSITKSLEAADSEREVDDVDSKLNLHFPPGEVVLDEGQFKRPKRKSHYSICSKAGLWEVASKFGYSSEQFGLQISLEKMVGSLFLFALVLCFDQVGLFFFVWLDQVGSVLCREWMNWRMLRKRQRKWLLISPVQCLRLLKLC